VGRKLGGAFPTGVGHGRPRRGRCPDHQSTTGYVYLSCDEPGRHSPLRHHTV
jgi:hypothetical protein